MQENAYDHLTHHKNSWTYMVQSGKDVFNWDAIQVKSVSPFSFKQVILAPYFLEMNIMGSNITH